MLGRALINSGRSSSKFATRRLATQQAAAVAEGSNQLVLNFTTPHAPVYFKKAVGMVILPGEAGEYGVTAGHSPIISELKPGVVSVIHSSVRSHMLKIFNIGVDYSIYLISISGGD